MNKILIVEHVPHTFKRLRLRLEEAGHRVGSESSRRDGLARLEREIFDLLIVDLQLPGEQGRELLVQAHEAQSALPIVLISDSGSVREAVDAMRLGAVEYAQQPLDLDALVMRVDQILESSSIRAEHNYLIDQVLEGEQQVDLVGKSAAMERVRALVDKVAPTRSNVLVLGESGTGKELVAQAIHERSAKRKQPLIKVNCPGIPATLFESELFGHMKGAFTGALENRKGKFELAGKGNILLDEIAEIPVELQAKLLRVLEERRFMRGGGSTEAVVDARVIAATNRDLEAMVNAGGFRADLFYRLNVFPIPLPPLRERKEDLPELSLHLLCHIGSSCGLIAKGISPAALQAFSRYHWPGNVRELRNVLERALVLAGGGVVDVDHLPMELQEHASADGDDRPESFQSRIDRIKRDLLLEALRETDWKKKEAAKQLGLSKRAFSHYVSRFELDSYRPSS